jgi:hypothetical protein
MVIMADDKEMLESYAATLLRKERELLLHKKKMLAFIDTPHTAKETREHLYNVREHELKLVDTQISLLDLKSKTPLVEEVERLCDQCRGVEFVALEMDRALREDLFVLIAAEEKSKLDVIKSVTFFLAVPGALLGLVRAGVGSGYVSEVQAAAAGAVFSSSVLARKKITSAFRHVSQSLTTTAHEVRNSFTLYYLRESAKSSANDVVVKVRTGSRELTAYLGRAAQNVRLSAKLITDPVKATQQKTIRPSKAKAKADGSLARRQGP